jgi:hypothetical protein
MPPAYRTAEAKEFKLMRSLGGFVLLAGIGVGLFVYWPAPVDRHTSLDNAQRFAATFAAQKQAARQPLAVPGRRTFSPGISLTSLAHDNTPSVSHPAVVGGWRTSASSEAAYKTSAPTDPDSRYRLVVDMQEQLKRVGCYYGRTDGSWGPGSKDAMQSFMERVNAALPSNEPDYVLLTLLKSQSGKVCGACPADQLVTSGGACVPRTTIAYGQRGEDATRTAASRETLPWQTTATAAKPAVKPLFTPLPTSVVSTEPLPGRMAIGGPQALPPVNSVYAPQTPAAGNGQLAVTTAAAGQQATGLPSYASTPSEPKPQKTYKRSHRRDGPGTPRYNLMLSLGGVY